MLPLNPSKAFKKSDRRGGFHIRPLMTKEEIDISAYVSTLFKVLGKG